jgi:hypothetical protein
MLLNTIAKNFTEHQTEKPYIPDNYLSEHTKLVESKIHLIFYIVQWKALHGISSL